MTEMFSEAIDALAAASADARQILAEMHGAAKDLGRLISEAKGFAAAQLDEKFQSELNKRIDEAVEIIAQKAMQDLEPVTRALRAATADQISATKQQLKQLREAQTPISPPPLRFPVVPPRIVTDLQPRSR